MVKEYSITNFKTFLEDIGLGNIGPQIDRLFNNKQFANQAGAYVSTDNTYSSPQGYFGDPASTPELPATSLTIPSVEKTGKIAVLLLKKNPIYIRLTDGTEAHFTYDEYKRIQGQPALGKTMTIFFQRHPEDRTGNVSQVTKAIVRE